MRASFSNGLPDLFPLVACKIVKDDDVAGL